MVVSPIDGGVPLQVDMTLHLASPSSDTGAGTRASPGLGTDTWADHQQSMPGNAVELRRSLPGNREHLRRSMPGNVVDLRRSLGGNKGGYVPTPPLSIDPKAQSPPAQLPRAGSPLQGYDENHPKRLCWFGTNRRAPKGLKGYTEGAHWW
eukprot:gene28034-31134_t